MNCYEVKDISSQFLRRGCVLRFFSLSFFSRSTARKKKKHNACNEFYMVNILTSRHRPSIMGHYVLIVNGRDCITYFDSY